MRQPEDERAVLVSVCCITFNQADVIRDALDGFVRQKTDFKYEILIHDDASTDGTADVIREYAERYPDRIFPILQTENQYSRGLTNISGTFNFPRARGRYIAMCEGDDYWTDEYKLQKQADFLEAHPGCSLCFHSARVSVQGRALTGRWMRPYRGSRRIGPAEIIDKTSGYPTASLMFRREMVEALPDFYVKAPIADIPLQLLAAAHGWAYYMDQPMCVYRLGGAYSWTNLMQQGDYEKKQREYARAMERMYRGFDEMSGGRFHGTVKHAVRRLWYRTWVNTRKFSKILARENRAFYRELDLRTRFFIRLEAAHPECYRRLREAFHRMPGGGR
ncbi:MAG: glycosyltransferase [Clostridiales bacterium]|nr:glycosyltransferase [Clostridiales bacterium]